jgi:hypothetical protein
MNPFIYSLRNRDMKESLRKPISRIPPPWWYFIALDLCF